MEVQACFDFTDWSFFEAAAISVNELTDTVTSNSGFLQGHVCVDQDLLHICQKQTRVHNKFPRRRHTSGPVQEGKKQPD